MTDRDWRDLYDGDDECFVDQCEEPFVVIFEDGVRHCAKHRSSADHGGHYRPSEDDPRFNRDLANRLAE